MDKDKKQDFLITCGREISTYLRKEVEDLGFSVKSQHSTGVMISASLQNAMKLNFCLRTALNVLYFVKQINCRNANEFYKEMFLIPWEDYIVPTEYISISARVNNPTIKTSVFASQKAKDAIVDRISEKLGSRPDSGPNRDNVVINLFWKDDKCWVYLNTSGRKLSDRNYRKIPYKAPMQEALAATLLQAANYNGSQTFVNPMCGSGTIAIEAALIALGKAPAGLRSNFGFMHLKGFDVQNWTTLRKELSVVHKKKPDFKIIASDIDKRAIEMAKRNAQTAGVDHCIEFHVCDFRDTPIPKNKGIVIFNPEYGHRLGDESELEETYKGMGDFLKQKCSGFTGYIFTGNMSLAKKVGLRASKRLVFFNARIECRFLEYQLYEGTKRVFKDD